MLQCMGLWRSETFPESPSKICTKLTALAKGERQQVTGDPIPWSHNPAVSGGSVHTDLRGTQQIIVQLSESTENLYSYWNRYRYPLSDGRHNKLHHTNSGWPKLAPSIEDHPGEEDGHAELWGKHGTEEWQLCFNVCWYHGRSMTCSFRIRTKKQWLFWKPKKKEQWTEKIYIVWIVLNLFILT